MCIRDRQYTDTTVPFRRGSITDRNGTMLANSVKVYNLVLDCVEINNNDKYKDPTKAALEEYFDIEQDVVCLLYTSPGRGGVDSGQPQRLNSFG